MPPRIWFVQRITNPDTQSEGVVNTAPAYTSSYNAAVQAQSLATQYKQQGYSITADQKYADIPQGYRPWLIYDYTGRVQGRPPGRNPNYRLVLKIQVVDQYDDSIDYLIASGQITSRNR